MIEDNLPAWLDVSDCRIAASEDGQQVMNS
jgi:hypothetical protein